MKILIPTSYYYNRGGDTTYMFALSALLESKGHDILPFAMHHPQNFNSPYSEYFTSYIDYVEELGSMNISSAIKVALRTIYSLEAKQNLGRLIEREKPDIAHAQNIHHHLTPSLFHILKKRNIPILWTLHDYSIICPNTSFLCRGKLCESCKKTRFYMAPLKRCKKDSLPASLMAAVENYAHRIMRIYQHVDYFLAPSKFLAKKIIEYGFPEKKILHLPYAVQVDDFEPNYTPGNYVFFAGRLAREKGVLTLLKAIKGLDITVRIAGDGPLRADYETYARENGINNAIFEGFKTGQELKSLSRNAAFSVIPSEWYENLPLTIIESFAYGKPVLGSNIGGITEMVTDGETGLLFEMGNAKDLRAKLKEMSMDFSMLSKMGIKARKECEQKYNPETHYNRLMEIYTKVLSCV